MDMLSDPNPSSLGNYGDADFSEDEPDFTDNFE
jgi:hypothetical protein